MKPYLRKEADMGIRGQLIILFSKLETSITLLTKVKKKNQAEDGKLHLKNIECRISIQNMINTQTSIKRTHML